MSDSILDGVEFGGADLSGADLRNASLIGADLSGAILDGAKFAGADLSGASLGGVEFHSALEGVRGVATTTTTTTTTTTVVTLPEGFSLPTPTIARPSAPKIVNVRRFFSGYTKFEDHECREIFEYSDGTEFESPRRWVRTTEDWAGNKRYDC